MKAIDLSKKQALDTVPKAIQQNNFTSNLDRIIQMTMYFVTEETKKKKRFRIFTKNCGSVVILFCFNVILK